jgi:uncharacterized protein (DUF2235 family)
MSKNVIFCSDGTWNGPGETDVQANTTDATNVFKIFTCLSGVDSPSALRLASEQERELVVNGVTQQIAKYIDGVGDSTNFLVKIMGGAFGAGLITRILRGYTFVSRNYEDGCEIFLVGFSRGAYTVRALSGFIAARGLLDPRRIDLSDKESAYRQAAAIWYDYRKDAMKNDPDMLGELQDAVLDLPGFFTRAATQDLIPNVQIKAIAVWETVGALGIPVVSAQGARINALQFADTTLSTVVSSAFHAVAIDEQRSDFTPTLWNNWKQGQVVVQTLFPGAHADVGGGYPTANSESGLSDGALAWIVGKLGATGVKFASPPAYRLAADAGGTAHEPWRKAPWNLLPNYSRQFPSGLRLHKSVVSRLHAGGVLPDPGQPPNPYLPSNLGSYIDKTGNAQPNIPVDP